MPATSSSNGSPSNQGSAPSSSSSSSSPGSKRATAPAAAALPARPCFTALPEVVHTAVLGFLAAWDVGSLLQLSKGVRAAVGPAIHSRYLPGHGATGPLVRLLRLCTNLQHLSIGIRLSEEEQQALAEAIGDGSTCVAPL